MNAYQLAEAAAFVRRRYDGLKVGYGHFAAQDGGGVNHDVVAVRVGDDAAGWYFEACLDSGVRTHTAWGVLMRDRWDRLDTGVCRPGEEDIFLLGSWPDMFAAIDAGVAFYRDGVGETAGLPMRAGF